MTKRTMTSVAKKSAPRKPAAKKAAAKKAAAKKAAVKKAAAKKAAAKKPAAKNPKPTKPTVKSPSQFFTPDGGPWGKCFLPRAAGERRYWLVKSEPDAFSWDDLLRAPNRTTHWDGVRNFA